LSLEGRSNALHLEGDCEAPLIMAVKAVLKPWIKFVDKWYKLVRNHRLQGVGDTFSS
jgi:hypothetical protein